MARFKVILDACVLYPAPIRDYFMWLSLEDIYSAKWTDMIHDEWINALLNDPKNTRSRELLERTRDLMDKNVREPKVYNFEHLIDSIELPDKDDRHVVAAAIKCNADGIVTFNLKDFPTDTLNAYDIDVLHPDDFLFYQLDMNHLACINALRNQLKNLKNPPVTFDVLMSIFESVQLPQTVSKLREYSQLFEP
jgi:predicted nucleic acid-binding protein